jgi:hypothetical protein
MRGLLMYLQIASQQTFVDATEGGLLLDRKVDKLYVIVDDFNDGSAKVNEVQRGRHSGASCRVNAHYQRLFEFLNC